MADDRLSLMFAALADPTRREIVARLAAGDATVGELAAPHAVSTQAISKHLKVLEQAGLVTAGREAQRRPRHLEAEVFDLMTAWIERYRAGAQERFGRLDAVLAELDATATPAPRAPARRAPAPAPRAPAPAPRAPAPRHREPAPARRAATPRHREEGQAS